MTWFNKFIAFISLTAIMLLGVLAIHSIKVDTLPIDYALGLISKNRAPLFTIKAKAMMTVVDPSLIALTTAIETARQAVSLTVGGVLNMIKATLRAIMTVIRLIKKVLNFVIKLLQKFAGKDVSLYSLLSGVRDLQNLDSTFKGFQSEFNQVWTDLARDQQNAQNQIALGQEAFAKVDLILGILLISS